MADTALVPLSLWIALALRLGTIEPQTHPFFDWRLLVAVTVAGIIILWAMRLHQVKLHAFDGHAVVRVGAAAGALAVATIAISYLGELWAPRSVPIILGAVFFFNAVVMRMAVLSFFTFLSGLRTRRVPVAIYGAGAAGTQLANALRQSNELRPVAFVDDNPALHGLIIGGARVYAPARLEDLVKKGTVKRVLVAIASLSLSQRERLTALLAKLPVEAQAIPSYVDLVSGRSQVNDLRPIDADDLLDREKVDLAIPQVAKAYAGRSVMVTGAGGSIGAELCRQLMECKPSRIVLFERNEYGLYEIERTLRPAADSAGIALVPCLASVIDMPSVEDAIEANKVDIILHAAAYKHVPLVEENELEGFRNNVIGTRNVAEAARKSEIERFILVSSDKAVRPTNIMGATKRMAELIVQDIQLRSPKTRFSMVRFGNVLESSGSVVPLFRQQIRSGGPVTVTHQDVTRYFMTIPEAARLVLLAGAYSDGDDLFVLDMGSPMRIVDLARRMIELANRSVRDDTNPDGDIEIKFIGLRPGEKLYEELLINDDSLVETPHPKILRAQDVRLSEIEIAGMLKQVNAAVEMRDRLAVRDIVRRYVDGYNTAAVSSAHPVKDPATN